MPISILHVGCGGDTLPPWLPPGEETRLDIDPRWKPNVVGSMLDMGDIGPFDVVFAAHCLEHVYPHEVDRALQECRRVLADGGSLILFVPDLGDVRPSEDILYESPAGPVTGLDMIYGMRSKIPEYPAMAHHVGFTRDTLRKALIAAGFAIVETRRLANFNLFAVAIK